MFQDLQFRLHPGKSPGSATRSGSILVSLGLFHFLWDFCSFLEDFLGFLLPLHSGIQSRIFPWDSPTPEPPNPSHFLDLSPAQPRISGGDGKSQPHGGNGREEKAGMRKIWENEKENLGIHPDGGARAMPGTRNFKLPPNPFFPPDPKSQIRPVL